ncbi:unnamed protein product [Rotaria magnacalcarata]|uniref:Uncharacterized protein n=1 Tax=Rotaria magnacalcarata TaxID=392030 RepID=A0A8S2JL74_9BILA|nr:unnamed protein product [Rotaria magnacalcarata]
MASVASNTTDTTSKPLMDQLTHAIIKETSKNLKYYIDVKRRENAFVLNPKSPFSDSTAVKAKLPNRSTKEHLSLYGSYYADKDTTNVLPSFQQKQTQFHPITTSPEKRMCREELNFHMRSYNFSPRESSKFSEIRAKPTMRLSSSCGIHRDCRPRTSLKLTRHEQDQLVDDAADILASLVKSRRSTNETNTLIQPTPALYISQPTTSSPRQTDDQSNIRSPMTYPATDLRIFSIKPKAKAKGEKRIIQDAPTKATSMARITVGHDRKDMQASWFLSKISISDPIRHKTSNILCNAWLSIKSIDQKTMRDFQVASVVSHQKTMISNDHREENESQSDYSTRTIEGTVRSNETNLSENILLTDYKPIQKNRKQQHVSIGPTTIAKRLSSMSTHTNNYSQLSPPPPPPLATIATIESHFNHDDLLLPPIVPRIHSAALSETSSDTEIESNMTNRTRSTSRTPSPTFHQTRLQPVSEYDTLQTKSTSSMFKRHSIDHDRPPARLEKRVSPLSVSVERPDKNNENNPFSFIE